jgi:hypothetical protein
MLAVLCATTEWAAVLLPSTWMSSPPSMFSTANTSIGLRGLKWALRQWSHPRCAASEAGGAYVHQTHAQPQ